ncbi:Permease, cytosine/purine, uracil, thiamine, allantoin family [Escherichia coli]|nr:Permease, cytosine/purine, uracil, thiamine, allantoin family [Escherichia coli]
MNNNAINALLSCKTPKDIQACGNDSNLLIVFYVQIMPDDLVMQLHRF